MQDWHYSLDGKNKIGPISKEELISLINQGRLNSQTLVWQEGMSEWVYVSTINSLFPRDVPPPLPNKSSIVSAPPLNREKTPPLPNHNISSSVVSSSIPPEIEGWNWGAFLAGAFWSIGNRVWIGLLCFIPYVGFAVSVYLGFKGNELAWKNGKWESIEQFKSTQKNWAIAGLILAILSLLLGIIIAANA